MSIMSRSVTACMLVFSVLLESINALLLSGTPRVVSFRLNFLIDAVVYPLHRSSMKKHHGPTVEYGVSGHRHYV